mgnify:CR=1 FL=1
MNTKTKRMLASMLSGMMLMTGAAAVVPLNDINIFSSFDLTLSGNMIYLFTTKMKC